MIDSEFHGGLHHPMNACCYREQCKAMEAALAESRAEVEALRASMEGDAANHVAIERDHHKARAERLAGALDDALEMMEMAGWHSDPAYQRIKAEHAALEQEPQE